MLVANEPWIVARRLFASYALAAACYVPWIPATIAQTRVGSPTLDRWASLGYDPRVILRALTYLLPFSSTEQLKLVLPVLVFAIIVVWAFVRKPALASTRLLGLLIAVIVTLCALAISGAQGGRYAFATIVFANVVWFAMALDVATYVLSLRIAVGRHAIVAGATAVGAIALFCGTRAGLQAMEPKSGITAFWEAERPGPGSIVIDVPDFLGPSVAFAGRLSPQVARESFVMDSCPAWMRFIGGYEQQWADSAFRAHRLAALLNAASGRTVYMIVEEPLHKIGRVDFTHGDVVERAFRQRFHAISGRTYPGTVDETVRVVAFRPEGRVRVSEDPRSARAEINGVDAPFSAAEFSEAGG